MTLSERPALVPGRCHKDTEFLYPYGTMENYTQDVMCRLDTESYLGHCWVEGEEGMETLKDMAYLGIKANVSATFVT